jgi:hypothetical protein
MEFEVTLDAGLIGCDEKACLEHSPLFSHVSIKRRKSYDEWYTNMSDKVLSLDIEDLTKLSAHFTVQIEHERYVCIKQRHFH